MTSGSNHKPCPPPLVEPIPCYASHPQGMWSHRTRHMAPVYLYKALDCSGSPETRDPKKLPAQTDPQKSTPPKFDYSGLSSLGSDFSLGLPQLFSPDYHKCAYIGYGFLWILQPISQ